MSAQVPAYGRCPCTGLYQRRFVDVNMTVDGNKVTMHEIPQGACPQCGSRVYKADVLEMVEAVMRGETDPHSAAP